VVSGRGVGGSAGGRRSAVYQAPPGLDTKTHGLCPVVLHAGGSLGKGGLLPSAGMAA